MRRLSTARQVIEALGGREAVMKLTDANKSAVWNWEAYFGAFPADCYAIMIKELAARDCTAGPHLWRQRGFLKGKAA